MNFRDVMLAYGKLSKDLMTHGHGGHQIGLEFSGKVRPKPRAPPAICIGLNANVSGVLWV